MQPQLDIDELLAECLERLVALSPIQSANQLEPLLPTSGTNRLFVLIELIKLDMAAMADQGELRRIDFYLDAFPNELCKDNIPLDLVLEEIQLSKQLGKYQSREDIVQRFPQFETVLEQLQQVSEATLARHSIKPPPEIAIDTQLDDFLVKLKLGKGAFATVYLAMQLSMQRPVALKISRGQGEESQSLSRFDHANIVRVYDQRNIADEDLHLLYMQFLPGGTLADVVTVLRQNTQLDGHTLLSAVDRNLARSMQSIPESSSLRRWIETATWPVVVAWIGTQLAAALQHAHTHGVLHRDVKPANVLLTAEGLPKLADFNVSFVGASGRAGAAASFGGSIGYMSPEHLRAISEPSQFGAENVSERADIYSLAVLLWELWQGHRPFLVNQDTKSWSEALTQQLTARSASLVQSTPARDASERALENNLRRALSFRSEDRPSSGSEFAARLKLTLHPEAAQLFDLEADPFRMFLLRTSPWLIAIVVILTPNIFGGLFNYQYNYHQVMTLPMRQGLEKLSWFVNLFFFPLGAAIIVYFALTLIRAVRAAKHGQPVSDRDIRDTIDLSHRAAIIGGSLWLIGGVTIPSALSYMFADLTLAQAFHLFISSLVCGGIAMIYPFFGMVAMCTWVYYPLYVKQSMHDPSFTDRQRWIVRYSEVYLLIAALIPLLGAALTSWHGDSRVFTLVAIGAGVVGLLASYFLQRAIVRAWNQMALVLATVPSS